MWGEQGMHLHLSDLGRGLCPGIRRTRAGQDLDCLSHFFFAVSEACFLYLSPSCLLLKSCLMGEKSSSVEFTTVIFFAASDFVHIVQLYADINVCFSL